MSVEAYILLTIAAFAVQVQVPADAVTTSGSGLDPNISVAYADLQINRIAAAYRVDPQQERAVVVDNTEGRAFGVHG